MASKSWTWLQDTGKAQRKSWPKLKLEDNCGVLSHDADGYIENKGSDSGQQVRYSCLWVDYSKGGQGVRKSRHGEEARTASRQERVNNQDQNMADLLRHVDLQVRNMKTDSQRLKQQMDLYGISKVQ